MGIRTSIGVVVVAGCVLGACGGAGSDEAEGRSSADAQSQTTAATSSEIDTAPAEQIPEQTVPEPTVPDKSGNSPQATLIITLANENDQAAGEAEGVEEFARQVEALSDGAMQVDITWHARQTEDVYTVVTEAVRDGSADMAFLGNNYWGYEGVTSTQAAQAPLLVRSFAQGVAVADDPELVDDLFSGLAEIGVVGLEMFPEDFKLLVDFESPVASPDDLAGRVLQAWAAPELYSFFEALGTTPQQPSAPDGPQLRVVPPWLQREFAQGTVVGNLPMYFVYFDLVANEQFWNGLDEGQREIVVAAAAAAQDLVVEHQTEQRSLDFIDAYCERGSAVNALDERGMAAFAAAAQTTIDDLAADTLTADLMARIAALAEDAPPTIYPVCMPERGGGDALPSGVYRFEVTNDDLQAAGIDADEWSADTGIYTFTLDDGTFTWTQQSDTDASVVPGEGAFVGGGTYQVDGDQLAMTEVELDPSDPITTTLTWAVDSDGTLTFEIVEATHNFARFLYGEPWLRIGEA